MRRLSVEDLQPGLVIARAIFSSDGRVLLHSGVILTASYIAKLSRFGINSVYIQDEIFGDCDIADVISDKTRLETTKLVCDSFVDLGKNHCLDTRAIKNQIDKIIQELLDNRGTLINLSDIRTFDDYTFAHSVNVCILSVMTGITMGFNHSQLRDLGLGALLHDIGKIKVDVNILNKPGELTREEFKEIKQHPKFGFDILRDHDDVSLLASHIAFQHHERWDGYGYPRNLKGDNIHEYSRVTTVADVYDALLADRPYRPSYSLNQTLGIMRQMTGIYLDPACMRALEANIAVYPIGTVVQLNTGDIGMVVDTNRATPNRPVIRLVFDETKKRLPTVREIDLSKLSTIMISAILSETDITALKNRT